MIARIGRGRMGDVWQADDLVLKTPVALKLMPREGLDAVVNLSVNQTLSRTVITAGTTFLSVVALYIFGGEALEGFAFTMLAGIVAGTYSTVFIASAIATLLSEGRQPGRRPRSRCGT